MFGGDKVKGCSGLLLYIPQWPPGTVACVETCIFVHPQNPDCDWHLFHGCSLMAFWGSTHVDVWRYWLVHGLLCLCRHDIGTGASHLMGSKFHHFHMPSVPLCLFVEACNAIDQPGAISGTTNGIRHDSGHHGSYGWLIHLVGLCIHCRYGTWP